MKIDGVKIIDGRSHSAKLITNIKKRIKNFHSDNGFLPGLSVIMVGNNPASEIYVKNKLKIANDIQIKAKLLSLSDDITEKDLVNEIEKLNSDDKVDGILVQLPLPKHIKETNIINKISPDKDVDGFHPINFGNLILGNRTLVPCTPLGCMYLIKKEISDINGKNAVIVGRSNIVGKPLSGLLLKENCTVTICHSKTKNLHAITSKADIIIAAIGQPEFITEKYVNNNSIVIDVGINRIKKNDEKTKIVGDVDFRRIVENVKKISPVPGGVGPMTIACLMYNTIKAASMRRNQTFEEFI